MRGRRKIFANLLPVKHARVCRLADPTQSIVDENGRGFGHMNGGTVSPSSFRAPFIFSRRITRILNPSSRLALRDAEEAAQRHPGRYPKRLCRKKFENILQLLHKPWEECARDVTVFLGFSKRRRKIVRNVRNDDVNTDIFCSCKSKVGARFIIIIMICVLFRVPRLFVRRRVYYNSRTRYKPSVSIYIRFIYFVAEIMKTNEIGTKNLRKRDSCLVVKYYESY